MNIHLTIIPISFDTDYICKIIVHDCYTNVVHQCAFRYILHGFVDVHTQNPYKV